MPYIARETLNSNYLSSVGA